MITTTTCFGLLRSSSVFPPKEDLSLPVRISFLSRIHRSQWVTSCLTVSQSHQLPDSQSKSPVAWQSVTVTSCLTVSHSHQLPDSQSQSPVAWQSVTAPPTTHPPVDLTFWSPLGTLCITRFNVNKFYMVITFCLCALRTNSNSCLIQH